MPFSTLLLDVAPPSDWLTREFSQLALAYKCASLDRPGCPTEYHCSVTKARGRVISESNGKALWSWADRTMASSSRCVCFACLSGQSYLSPGERSAVIVVNIEDNLQTISCFPLVRFWFYLRFRNTSLLASLILVFSGVFLKNNSNRNLSAEATFFDVMIKL